MAKLVAFIFSLVVCGVAPAQSIDDKPRLASFESVVLARKIEDRAIELRPYRREEPVRANNITDREVEEIKLATANVMPGAIVNIGTVVKGCPCEDGSYCSDQVWIVAHRSNQSTGFLLSRVRGHWTIGPVQKWWWDYEKFLAKREWFTVRWAELMERFPACSEHVEIPKPSDNMARQ